MLWMRVVFVIFVASIFARADTVVVTVPGDPSRGRVTLDGRERDWAVKAGQLTMTARGDRRAISIREGEPFAVGSTTFVVRRRANRLVFAPHEGVVTDRAWSESLAAARRVRVAKDAPPPVVVRRAAREAARRLACESNPEDIEHALLLGLAAGSWSDPEFLGRLGRLRAAPAIAKLRRWLEHEQAEVRRAAARVLAAIPGGVSDALLYRAAAREKDEATRTVLRDVTTNRVDPARLAALRATAMRGDLDKRRRAASALGQFARRHPAARDIVGELLRRRDEATAILLLDTVRASRDHAWPPLLAPALRHADWRVRVAAIEACARVRVLGSIRLLVERVTREKGATVRRALGRALHTLTHLQLGTHKKLWKKWWAERGDGFLVPASPPSQKVAPKDGARRTVARFFGVAIEGRHVVFVVDRSASMMSPSPGGGSRWDRALKEMRIAIEAMDAKTSVNVVLFSSDVWVWRKTPVRASSGMWRRLAPELAKRGPRGGTWLFDGLKAALQLEGVEAIYLLSDGEPSGGRFTQADRILEELRTLNQIRRAQIHCVAVGLKSKLLRELAAGTGGTYTEKR